MRSDSTVVEAVKLVYSLLDNKLCNVILRKYRNKFLCFSIDFFSFGLAEVVLLTFAPVLIMVDKGIQGHFTDTVHMPVCRCKINPFLAAVTACRTVKVSIHTRIGLIKDADKIIAMDNSLLDTGTERSCISRLFLKAQKMRQHKTEWNQNNNFPDDRK